MSSSPERESPFVPTTRDAYAEAGTAMRESITRFLASQARMPRTTRVLLAVLELTASYSRVSDRVYVPQIAKLAKIPGDVDERHTRRALKELHERGVIVWEPSCGRRKPSWVSLRQPEKTRPLMALVSDEKPGQLDPEKPGHLASENPAASGPPTENVYREGLVREACTAVAPAGAEAAAAVRARDHYDHEWDAAANGWDELVDYVVDGLEGKDAGTERVIRAFADKGLDVDDLMGALIKLQEAPWARNDAAYLVSQLNQAVQNRLEEEAERAREEEEYEQSVEPPCEDCGQPFSDGVCTPEGWFCDECLQHRPDPDDTRISFRWRGGRPVAA